MRDLTPVGPDYPTSGPNQHTLVQPIDVPAATLFACLVDAPAWGEWLGLDVEWTTEPPFGVGTTRTVRARGVTIDEHFFTWDDSERIGFRFDRATLPVTAFAELYDCVPTGDDSCELHWSFAFEFRGRPVSGPAGNAFAAVFVRNGRRSLTKLAALLESDPDRFAHH